MFRGVYRCQNWKKWTPGKSLCPFWDGENVTLLNGCWWPPTGGMKRSLWITWLFFLVYLQKTQNWQTTYLNQQERTKSWFYAVISSTVCFIFTPILGEMIQIRLFNIFQMGWLKPPTTVVISDLKKTHVFFPGLVLPVFSRAVFFPAGPGILEDWWKARATMVWGRLVRNRLALGCVSTGPTWIFVAKDFFFFFFSDGTFFFGGKKKTG